MEPLLSQSQRHDAIITDDDNYYSVILFPLTHTRFTEWLFTTRMSFYNHDLQLPWWFGAACWNFAIAGLIMLWTTAPQWMETSNSNSRSASKRNNHIAFPYRTMALMLIFVQSPLSFLADYRNMTHDSYWHVVDRCLALPLMGTEVVKFLLMCRHSFLHYYDYHYRYTNRSNSNDNHLCKSKQQHYESTIETMAMHPTLVVLYGVAIGLAVFSFVQSTAAQSNLDRDAFVFWHTAWHLYPLVASAIVLFDFYACHGWKRSTREYLYAIEVHIIHGNNNNNNNNNNNDKRGNSYYATAMKRRVD